MEKFDVASEDPHKHRDRICARINGAKTGSDGGLGQPEHWDADFAEVSRVFRQAEPTALATAYETGKEEETNEGATNVDSEGAVQLPENTVIDEEEEGEEYVDYRALDESFRMWNVAHALAEGNRISTSFNGCNKAFICSGILCEATIGHSFEAFVASLFLDMVEIGGRRFI